MIHGYICALVHLDPLHYGMAIFWLLIIQR